MDAADRSYDLAFTAVARIWAEWPSQRHQPCLGLGLLHTGEHFGAHKVDEPLHLPVHLLHALAHLEDDCDSRNIHAQIPRQVQDELQPLQVLIGIEPRIAVRPRRPQQSLALIQSQRLRMNRIHLRHRRDHIRAL